MRANPRKGRKGPQSHRKDHSELGIRANASTLPGLQTVAPDVGTRTHRSGMEGLDNRSRHSLQPSRPRIQTHGHGISVAGVPSGRTIPQGARFKPGAFSPLKSSTACPLFYKGQAHQNPATRRAFGHGDMAGLLVARKFGDHGGRHPISPRPDAPLQTVLHGVSHAALHLGHNAAAAKTRLGNKSAAMGSTSNYLNGVIVPTAERISGAVVLSYLLMQAIEPKRKTYARL